MHIYKFSLPEGSDLKVNYYGAEAQIRVMYKDQLVALLGVLILGEKTIIRRGVMGTSFVVSCPEPGYRCDLTSRIRRHIKEYDEGYGQLGENLKHLEGMRINPTTMHMINEQARQVYDQTRERMSRAAEQIRPMEQAWAEQVLGRSREALHSQSYDQLVNGLGITIRADENIRPEEMIVTTSPSVATMAMATSGLTNIGGNNYTINRDGYARLVTGEPIRIAPNNGIVHIHGIV
jgi:hypothetical protein